MAVWIGVGVYVLQGRRFERGMCAAQGETTSRAMDCVCTRREGEGRRRRRIPCPFTFQNADESVEYRTEIFFHCKTFVGMNKKKQ